MLTNIGWSQESNYLLFTKQDNPKSLHAIGPGSFIRIRGIFLNGMDMDMKGTVDRVTKDTIIFKIKGTAAKHERLAIPLVNIHTIILNPNTTTLIKIGTFLIVLLMTILLSALFFKIDSAFNLTKDYSSILLYPLLALFLSLIVVIPLRKKNKLNRIEGLSDKWKVELVVKP